MPSVKQYQGIEYSGFPQGLNNHADSSRLEPNELAVALNVRLGPRGEVSLRNGYIRGDDTITLDDQIDWLYPWRSADPQDHLIVVENDGTILHSTTGGAFVDSSFSTIPTDTLQMFGTGFASAADTLYVSSKLQTDVIKFDGTTWNSVLTIPKGKMLHHRHGRMFAINDLVRPSAVYFSALLDPEAFGTEDYIEFDPDDGYEINASAIFGDDLIVFKDSAVWKLSGRTPSSFATYRLDNHRGCVSPRSTDQMRGRLFFFDRDTGCWAFDGASFELVSEPINDYILANQDYDLAYKASAYVAEDRFYLAIPWEGGGHHTFVYFGDTGGWVEYDTGFEDAVEYLNDRFLGLPGADGVYNADITSQIHPPSVTPLVARFRTGWTLIAGPGSKARVRRIEATVKANVGVTGTVRMFRDYDEVTPYKVRTFEGGPTVFAAIDASERRVALDGWGNRVHAVQFEFETNEFPFQLNDLTVFYTGGIDVRGER